MTRDTTVAEREVQRARSDLSATIDSLKHKLTASEIIEELRMQFLPSDTAGLTRIANSFSRQAQDNPMALALAGAGIAWLMLGRGTHGHNGHATGDYDAAGQGYAERGGEIAHRTGESAGSAIHRAGSAAGSAVQRAGDWAGSAGDSVSRVGRSLESGAYRAASGAREAIGQARANARDATRTAQTTARDMLHDYPLVVGAIAIAAGAAIGAAIPSTRAEDEQLGDASDRVKENVSDQARSAAREASAAAREFRDSATGTAGSAGSASSSASATSTGSPGTTTAGAAGSNTAVGQSRAAGAGKNQSGG